MDGTDLLQEIGVFTDNDPVVRCFDAHHIPGGGIREAKTAALTDSVIPDASMLAKQGAIHGDNRTGCIVNALPSQKGGQTLREKADVLAFLSLELQTKHFCLLVDL